MGATFDLLLIGVLAALLLVACWTDLVRRTIPNPLNLAIAIGAPLHWWAMGLPLWPGAAIQIGLAAAVFALFTVAWLMRAMGGGDVKLIGAVALWLTFQELARFLFVMAILGGVLTLGMLARHRIRRGVDPVEVPYGVAIAAAAMWLIGERYLYQFG